MNDRIFIRLPRRRALALAAGSLAAPMLASGIARAQTDWPNKTVRYINGFPPGGATDLLSRQVCQKLSELTGQQFVVENRAGAGGNVGADAVAKADPDGYTLGLMSVAPHGIAPTLYSKLPFNAAKDFTFVSTIWSLPNLLITRLALPPNNLAELIAFLKANSGKHSFASSGAGTTVHLSGEMFKQAAGVDMLHVPYRGSGPALQDLFANQVDMIFDNIPTAIAHARGGKVKAIAVTSAQRNPAAPDVPAIAELLPGFEMTSWGGICGPAGLPRAVVDKLSGLMKRILDDPDMRAKFQEQGATPFWKSPADSAAYRDQEEVRLAPIIRASGAKVD